MRQKTHHEIAFNFTSLFYYFPNMKFEEFGFNEQLLEALSYMNFQNATPIQEQAIPPILEGKDIIGCAQTGTGKTGAFILPVLNKLVGKDIHETNTLVLVPTRELAIQIDQQIHGFAYFTGTTCIAVYGGGGGTDWDTEKKALSKGADIIVATPGRLIAHLNMGYVKFDKVQHLILDEADRMLDIGFHDDILKIITYLPNVRQTLMFSATMPPKIRTLAKKILTNPVEIAMSISKPAEGVLQAAYLANDHQKIKLVKKLIADKPNYKSILIFCSTKKKVSELTRALQGQHFSVEGISSELEQDEREEVLLRFRSRKTRVLVATDVMSRGIDIKDINLVINFDVPGDAEDYVHRVGRTARADTTGVAITLINEDDMQKFQRIEDLIERELMKLPVPPEFGESPAWNPRSTFRKFAPKPGGGKTFQKSGFKKRN